MLIHTSCRITCGGQRSRDTNNTEVVFFVFLNHDKIREMWMLASREVDQPLESRRRLRGSVSSLLASFSSRASKHTRTSNNSQETSHTHTHTHTHLAQFQPQVEAVVFCSDPSASKSTDHLRITSII